MSKKIFAWMLFSCLSYLPIASACSSNQTTGVNHKKVDTQSSKSPNKPNSANGMLNIDALNTNGEPQQNQSLNQMKADNSHQDEASNSAQDQSMHQSGMISEHPKIENQADPNQPNSTEANQVDEESLTLTPTKFPDFNNLVKNISVAHTTYEPLFADNAWAQLINQPDQLLKLFHNANQFDQKYVITIKHDKLTFADAINGQIKDLIAHIKFNEQFQDLRFNLVGMKKQPISNQLQKKYEQFLVQKTNISEQLKGLFPSFLASMLYYADNIPKTRPIESQELKLDYYNFLNGNGELLNLDHVSLNSSLLSQLFTYQKQGDYVAKVVGIKFDDLNGTFGLKMRIQHAEANNYHDPQYEEEFEFSGFRKLQLTNPAANVLHFSLLATSLKKILQESHTIQPLIKQHQNEKFGFDFLADNVRGSLGNFPIVELTHKLYKHLGGVIDDLEHDIYYSSYHENLSFSALGAIAGNFGIYPFYTRYARDSLFNNLSLTITQGMNLEHKNITLKFDVQLPIFVIDNYTTIQDLYSSVNQYLVLPVSSTIALTDALKPD